MNFIKTAVLLSMLVIASDAWFLGILQTGCKWACSAKCTIVCPLCAPGCYWGCDQLCGRKRRSGETINDGTGESEESGSFKLQLPCKFDAWDLNTDGSISIQEFAFTGHSDVENENTIVMFSKIDTNGDEKLSEEELNSAPLTREC